jgi:hypothetical protein
VPLGSVARFGAMTRCRPSLDIFCTPERTFMRIRGLIHCPITVASDPSLGANGDCSIVPGGTVAPATEECALVLLKVRLGLTTSNLQRSNLIRNI